jgi:hypothetical protein
MPLLLRYLLALLLMWAPAVLLFALVFSAAPVLKAMSNPTAKLQEQCASIKGQPTQFEIDACAVADEPR